jgi:hypothetical protein
VAHPSCGTFLFLVFWTTFSLSYALVIFFYGNGAPHPPTISSLSMSKVSTKFPIRIDLDQVDIKTEHDLLLPCFLLPFFFFLSFSFSFFVFSIPVMAIDRWISSKSLPLLLLRPSFFHACLVRPANDLHSLHNSQHTHTHSRFISLSLSLVIRCTSWGAERERERGPQVVASLIYEELAWATYF